MKRALPVADIFLKSVWLAAFLGSALIVAFLAPLAGVQAAPAQKPNILLILADDMGWGDLGCHGNDKLATPALDALQSQSVSLERFYVSPVCAPTRASLLAGRHHVRLRVLNTTSGLEVMHGDEVTLAEALKPAGYASGCFGKWHNGANHPSTARGQGFDEFFGFNGGFFSNYFDPALEQDGVTSMRKGYITDVLADSAMAFIEKHRSEPFFCYVPFNAPHSPMQAPEDLFAKYSTLGFERKTAAVYAMVENIDDNVGRILAKLDALDLAGNTIVMFLSDNGPNTPRFNGGMRGGKGSLFEGGQRVPFFIRWPGKLEPGRRVTQIAQHVDVLPTLLDLVEAPSPTTHPLDGLSLAPLLRGEEVEWPERLLFELSGRGGKDGNPIPKYPGTVRSDTHRWVHDNKQEMLFDLRSDPGEKNNIAAQQPEIAARLAEAYDAWFAEATAATQGKVQRFPITLTDGTDLLAPYAAVEGGATFFGKGWDNDWLVFPGESAAAVWNLELPQSGDYEVTVLHTAKEPGGKIQVTAEQQTIETGIADAHDPPEIPRPDLVPRWEVPDKVFAPLKLGTLMVPSGLQTLRITATPGIEIQSVRLNRAGHPDADLATRVSTTPTPRPEPAAWMEKVDRHVALAKRGGWEVVLVGDSITEGWRSTGKKAWDTVYPAHQPLNLGVTADKTENVLWRLDHGQLDGYEPKVFVVMIGTNNVGHRPPHLESAEDTVAGVKAILDRIAEAAPEAKVILMGLLPRGATAEDPRRHRIEVVNPQLRKLADERRVHWLDLRDEFLQADGTFVPGVVVSDFLHLTEKGYEVWARAMQPLLLSLVGGKTESDLRLPSIFSDHMVLQCEQAVPVWGWARAGEKVTIEFAGQSKTATANAQGKWTMKLDPLAATGESRKMRVSAASGEARVIRDAIVGEVWLGSGQSNMEQMMFSQMTDETATAVNPMLRQFITVKRMSLEASENVEGFWLRVEPGRTETMSAAGYFFSKSIHEETKRPVGVIKAAWGGRNIESFISPAAHDSVERFRESRSKALENLKAKSAAFSDWLQATGRADRPTADLQSFLHGEASLARGWVEVQDSGLVSDPALPQYGAVWLRKEIELTAGQVRVPQYLFVGFRSADFFRVYLNGKLVEQEDMEDYTDSSGLNSRIYLMPEDLREGVNQLALRVFAPCRQTHLAWAPSLNGKAYGGGWLAKAEFALPEVPRETKRPVLPPPMFTVGGSIYNGMIHPLAPYALRGVIWYQGESNTRDALSYRELMPLLIQDWRSRWGNDRLPFFFCQLANWSEKTDRPVESSWAELREAQSMTLSVPDTGMAVLIDTGESKDIHPQSKDVVGERLARIALAKTYGKPIPFSGPVYDSMKVEGSRIRVRFQHLEGGLVARDVPPEYPVMRRTGEMSPLVRNSPNSELEGFAICGEDRNWVWADAKIDGDTVLVWSGEVTAPIAVRYGWAENPTCNLYNRADLPASPFRTDDFLGR